MKSLTALVTTAISLCLSPLYAEEPKPDLSPVISMKGELIFKDDFDSPEKKPEWYGKHGTQWSIVDGALQGRPSSKEFQEKRIAKGDRAHSGGSPAGRLKVPTEDCILLFRFKMSDGLTEAHFGFDDGYTDTQHLGRFIVSTKTGIAIQRDKNAKVKGDENRIVTKGEFVAQPDTWYWIMLEVVGEQMVGQISGGPVLKASDARFSLPKGQINLPARGHGGTIYYDHVRVWKALSIK